MQAARNTIVKGTEVCSKNEDVWLEAIRLQVCKQCGTCVRTAYKIINLMTSNMLFLALLPRSVHTGGLLLEHEAPDMLQ